MATQTVEFLAVYGQALTAKLYAVGSDTVTQTASVVTEQTNRIGVYRATFTDAAAGEYELHVATSGGVPVARWYVTLTLTTATFASYDTAVRNVTNRVTANADQWGGVAVTGMPMPTYTQPAGFLGATFPAILASPTNITAATGIVLAPVTHTGARIPFVTLVDTTTVNSDMRGTDNALLAASYTAPLSASQTRTALGLASANLDTQLSDMPTVAEFEARTILSANYATASSQTAIKSVTDKINTGLVQNGAVYQFTASMLELASGGGGGSATLENQTAILQSLAGIQGTGFASAANSLVELTTAINTGINSIITQSTPTIGTIVGFPSKLHIGDSYTTATGNAITVFLRDANGSPIVAVGSKQFTDLDFAPTVVISQGSGVGRVEALVSYHAPQNAEPYLRIQIPSSRSRRGYAGVATMQATLRWSDAQMTLATQVVEWIPQI